jgi:HPt (histidine-containing phosphotransfer) domain-containing protein
MLTTAVIDPKGTADEQFEELRQHFQQRLRKEQAQLSALTRALEGAEVAPVSIFVDIRAFAHRLRGAALVFGFKVVGDGAKAVELAAIAAAVGVKGRRGIPSVAATMQALALTLSEEIGPTAAHSAESLSYVGCRTAASPSGD